MGLRFPRSLGVIALLIAVLIVLSGTNIDRLTTTPTPIPQPAENLDTQAQTPTPTPTPLAATPPTAMANPWPTPSVVVAIRNRAAPDRNITAAVADALAYWQAHTRYGHYNATFQLEPNASSPALIVWYNTTITCPTTHAAGCAPRLNASLAAHELPVSVQIKHNDSSNFRQTRNVIIHEFGHILGLDHCTAPYWIMSTHYACPTQSVRLPDVTDKPYAWRDPDLTYFADYGGTGAPQQTQQQVQHAIQYFERGADDTVPLSVSFRRAESVWRADITIQFGACATGYAVCVRTVRVDPDGDGRAEYHTQTVITVAEPDVEARGWYVGWGLATSLTPDGQPAVFVNTSYQDRRSEWWTT